MAFPNLLPTGCFGYKVVRDVKLTPLKYFNQRLLNYKQHFASNSDYIFFAQFVLQQLSLYSLINIAMKKSLGNVTAGMLASNLKQTVQSAIAANSGFTFMNTIKGSPAYWKCFQLEVLAMMRQFGCHTFFMTLSAADLHWDELVLIISKFHGSPMSDSDVKNLSYMQRCAILNSNPVFVARHFQYRVESFFVVLLFNAKVLGKITYYAIRIEFQFRGVAPIHSFIWVSEAPELSSVTTMNYITFVD